MDSSAPAVQWSPERAEASITDLGREAFLDLESWLGSAGCRRLGLLAIEREIELCGQEVHRLLLQEHIDRCGPGDVGAALRVSTPEGPAILFTHKRIHVRSVVTLLGQVPIARMSYGIRGRRSLDPLEAELQLPGPIYSYEVQRRVVKAAVQGPIERRSDGSTT